MKKFVSIILCLVLLLSFCGCKGDKNLNIDVSEKEISDILLLNKITNQVNYNYLSYAFLEPDLSLQYAKVVLPENEEEVKDYLLESKIIVEECKSLDVLFTVDEAKQTTQSQFEQVKQEPSQREYYNTILSVLQENDITETEYLGLLESESYYKYNKIALKNHFSDKKYDSSKSESLDEQFNTYVDKLVDEYLK